MHISIKCISDMLGVTTSTVRRWINKYQIPVMICKGKRDFSVIDLDYVRMIINISRRGRGYAEKFKKWLDDNHIPYSVIVFTTENKFFIYILFHASSDIYTDEFGYKTLSYELLVNKAYDELDKFLSV